MNTVSDEVKVQKSLLFLISIVWERACLFERSYVISHVVISNQPGQSFDMLREVSCIYLRPYAEKQTEGVTLEFPRVSKAM